LYVELFDLLIAKLPVNFLTYFTVDPLITDAAEQPIVYFHSKRYIFLCQYFRN